MRAESKKRCFEEHQCVVNKRTQPHFLLGHLVDENKAAGSRPRTFSCTRSTTIGELNKQVVSILQHDCRILLSPGAAALDLDETVLSAQLIEKGEFFIKLQGELQPGQMQPVHYAVQDLYFLNGKVKMTTDEHLDVEQFCPLSWRWTLPCLLSIRSRSSGDIVGNFYCATRVDLFFELFDYEIRPIPQDDDATMLLCHSPNGNLFYKPKKQHLSCLTQPLSHATNCSEQWWWALPFVEPAHKYDVKVCEVEEYTNWVAITDLKAGSSVIVGSRWFEQHEESPHAKFQSPVVEMFATLDSAGHELLVVVLKSDDGTDSVDVYTVKPVADKEDILTCQMDFQVVRRTSEIEAHMNLSMQPEVKTLGETFVLQHFSMRDAKIACVGRLVDAQNNLTPNIFVLQDTYTFQ
jgi:hypothetical protein